MNVDGLKIVDATLRDGGLVNDFAFDDSFVKALYQANLAAGVDYMEFGYRASRRQFDPCAFGKWKFTSDQDVWEAIGEKDPRMKLSIMVDVGRTDFREDIAPRKDSPIDLFRVATYMETMPEAIEMINYISSLGYETTCNIMAISKCTDEQIAKALYSLAATPALAIYVVDSYGALYPKQARKLTRLYHNILAPVGKEVGMHAHNNQQCAFANTIEARDCGAKWLDGTAFGMGRGAGNCHLEALLGCLNGKKYHIEPLLRLIQEQMLPMKEAGIVWGYNTSYLLTGLANQHPRMAIAATKEKDYEYVEQFKVLSYQ
ncbi:MAG: aldolase catalytic domain-containing protein [Blautia sp.]|nr:aldolase catalytic domain-containing protein [Blautia sp.]